MVDPKLVTADYSCRDKKIPDLGLVEEFSYQWRVYVLELEHDCVYVGIAHRSKVRDTILRHFILGDDKPHYTAVHPPKSVLLVWPAISPAVEAYVY